tara:strand:+ start:91 stop:561 length:471 start_codon:yes stop_codon:yes gene_type:complete
MRKYRNIIATVISIILFIIIYAFLSLEEKDLNFTTNLILMLNIIFCGGIGILISQSELRFFSIRKKVDFSTKDGFRTEIYIHGIELSRWLEWLAWFLGTFAIFIMHQLVDYIVLISGYNFFYILSFILFFAILGGASSIYKSAQSSYREECDKLNE